MEAFLLTLDVIFMGLLAFRVIRVYRSGNEEDLGLFAYQQPSKKTSREIKAGD
jgi:hypothetical protein